MGVGARGVGAIGASVHGVGEPAAGSGTRRRAEAELGEVTPPTRAARPRTPRRRWSAAHGAGRGLPRKLGLTTPGGGFRLGKVCSSGRRDQKDRSSGPPLQHTRQLPPQVCTSARADVSCPGHPPGGNGVARRRRPRDAAVAELFGGRKAVTTQCWHPPKQVDRRTRARPRGPARRGGPSRGARCISGVGPIIGPRPAFGVARGGRFVRGRRYTPGGLAGEPE